MPACLDLDLTLTLEVRMILRSTYLGTCRSASFAGEGEGEGEEEGEGKRLQSSINQPWNQSNRTCFRVLELFYLLLGSCFRILALKHECKSQPPFTTSCTFCIFGLARWTNGKHRTGCCKQRALRMHMCRRTLLLRTYSM